VMSDAYRPLMCEHLCRRWAQPSTVGQPQCDRTRRGSFARFGYFFQALALRFRKRADRYDRTDEGDEADDGAGVTQTDSGQQAGERIGSDESTDLAGCRGDPMASLITEALGVAIEIMEAEIDAELDS